MHEYREYEAGRDDYEGQNEIFFSRETLHPELVKDVDKVARGAERHDQLNPADPVLRECGEVEIEAFGDHSNGVDNLGLEGEPFGVAVVPDCFDEVDISPDVYKVSKNEQKRGGIHPSNIFGYLRY